MDSKALALLRVMRGSQSGPGGQSTDSIGAKLVTVLTDNPVTMKFEGRDTAVDEDVFIIPVYVYPLMVGDILTAIPFGAGASLKWMILQKMNTGHVTGTFTMQGWQIDGYSQPLTDALLVKPPNYTNPQLGDYAVFLPTGSPGEIKYILMPMG